MQLRCSTALLHKTVVLWFDVNSADRDEDKEEDKQQRKKIVYIYITKKKNIISVMLGCCNRNTYAQSEDEKHVISSKQRGWERKGPPEIIQKFRLRNWSICWPLLGEGFWWNIRRPLVLPAPLFYCWCQNHHDILKNNCTRRLQFWIAVKYVPLGFEENLLHSGRKLLPTDFLFV